MAENSVLLVTDASYHPNNGIGAWAFAATLPHGARIGLSGPCTSVCRNSHQAESEAVVCALLTARERWPGYTELTIVSDNYSAIRLLADRRRYQSGHMGYLRAKIDGVLAAEPTALVKGVHVTSPAGCMQSDTLAACDRAAASQYAWAGMRDAPATIEQALATAREWNVDRLERKILRDEAIHLKAAWKRKRGSERRNVK